MEKNKIKNFKKELSIKNNKSILELKEKYENNEIFENDLSEEEIKELIKLYEQEEKKIDEDIAIKKLHIANMLKKK